MQAREEKKELSKVHCHSKEELAFGDHRSPHHWNALNNLTTFAVSPSSRTPYVECTFLHLTLPRNFE